MNKKTKQTAAVAMATVLSVSTGVNSVTVRAQESDTTEVQTAQNNENEQKEKEIAPSISLPENLEAQEGTTLKEVALPENWKWVDESMILSTTTDTYPACFTVDDETYDYTTVDGYHEAEHSVEVQVP
uniref:hypothetical protein n=1 Tax=[Eubacterium] hominis TaxID=2764325 RepID=UPI003A4D30BE